MKSGFNRIYFDLSLSLDIIISSALGQPLSNPASANPINFQSSPVMPFVFAKNKLQMKCSDTFFGD